MKTHYILIRPLALILAIMLVTGMAAGCSKTTGSVDPLGTETVSNAQPTAATDQSTESGNATEAPTLSADNTEPDNAAEAPTLSADITEPNTETEETTSSTKPTNAVEPTGSTGNPEPTEHTHSFLSKVTPPSCTAKGYTTYTCSICGYSYTGKETAATGHSYQSTVIAPTCTTDGYTLHKCTVCGDSYSDNIIAATGHTWGQWTTVVEATYTSEGREERICSVCGTTESRQIAKLVMSASQMEQEVFRLVNVEREKAGLAPLQYYSAGQEAADIRAKEIQQSFSHTRPDGRSCFTVLEDLSLGGFMTMGENIAYGYPTPESVMAGWMNSDGHRANILNASFTGIVVGYANGYWVQIFIG